MKVSEEVSTVVSTFLELDKNIAWVTGHVYEGHSLKRSKDGWFLVLRVTTSKGTKKVAFVAANTPYDCMALVVKALHSTSFTLKWTDDRY